MTHQVTITESPNGMDLEECTFCRKTFRSKIRKSNLRSNLKESVNPMTSLEHVWSDLGLEIRSEVELPGLSGVERTTEEKGGGRNSKRRIPPVCVQCCEIVVEVERIQNEIAGLQRLLEAGVNRLRIIIECSRCERTPKEFCGVKDEDVVKNEENEMLETSGGGEGADFSNDPCSDGEGGSDSDFQPDLTDADSSDEVEALNDTQDDTSFADVTKSQEARRKGLGKQNQTCEFCSKSFPVSKMPTHLRSHVGDYILKCLNPKCRCSFVTYQTLILHITNNKLCNSEVSRLGLIPPNPQNGAVESAVATCNLCDFAPKPKPSTKNFHWAQMLQTHIREEHDTEEKNFKCPVVHCTEKFSARQSVHLHLSQHLKSKQKPDLPGFQSCRLCSRSIKMEAILEHYKSEHQITDALQCRICSLTFIKLNEFLQHHKKKHGSDHLICHLCPENSPKFSKQSECRKHFFEEHQIGEQFSCEYCSETFSVEGGLRSHMRFAHSHYSNFKCDICNSFFPGKVQLTGHKVKEHNDPGFPCLVCFKVCLSPALLKLHEKEVHLKQGPHRGRKVAKSKTCEECGKSFQNAYWMECHVLRAHPKDKNHKPWVCDQCGKAYFDKESLRTHVRMSHNSKTGTGGNRKFVCDTCGVAFKTGCTLKRHKVIHSGERPFGCEKCGQRFRHKQALERHLKSHNERGKEFRPKGEMAERKGPQRKRVEKAV